MQNFNLPLFAVVKRAVLPFADLIIIIIFLTLMLASLSIGFNNTNVELESASLKLVRGFNEERRF